MKRNKREVCFDELIHLIRTNEALMYAQKLRQKLMEQAEWLENTYNNLCALNRNYKEELEVLLRDEIKDVKEFIEGKP